MLERRVRAAAAQWQITFGLMCQGHGGHYEPSCWLRYVAGPRSAPMGTRSTPSTARPRQAHYFAESVLLRWRPQGDSNPRYRRERAMS